MREERNNRENRTYMKLKGGKGEERREKKNMWMEER